jgi:hypothetical protein
MFWCITVMAALWVVGMTAIAYAITRIAGDDDDRMPTSLDEYD